MGLKWEWSLNKPLFNNEDGDREAESDENIAAELPMKKPERENEGLRDQAGHNEQGEVYRSAELSLDLDDRGGGGSTVFGGRDDGRRRRID